MSVTFSSAYCFEIHEQGDHGRDGVKSSLVETLTDFREEYQQTLKSTINEIIISDQEIDMNKS